MVKRGRRSIELAAFIMGFAMSAQAQVATRFTYDHTGRRIEKVTSNVRTNTLLDGAYEVISGPTPSTTKYIQGPAGLVASITKGGAASPNAPAAYTSLQGTTTAGPPQGRRYHHPDHLGSISVVTDERGTEVGRCLYSPYGELLRSHSTGQDTSRKKFNGQEEDQETGLQYYVARYRDPETTLWLTADLVTPREDTMGHNRYSYVRGNPLRYIDPTGHEERPSKVLKKREAEGGVVIIVPTQGDDVWSFRDSAALLNRELYGGRAKIVHAKVTATLITPEGAKTVSIKSIKDVLAYRQAVEQGAKVEFAVKLIHQGRPFSFENQENLRTVITLSHAGSQDGPNLAFGMGGFQPWGRARPDNDALSEAGVAFWKQVGGALRSDGKIIGAGCHLGQNIYAEDAPYMQRAGNAAGRTAYGPADFTNSGDPQSMLRHVRAIERGEPEAPMTRFDPK